ncbi:MAG: DUF721 domain-containing protein [Actinomycetota bacterium]|nr:DUF721 domain-containing protein [Actinomycetota bacterium]
MDRLGDEVKRELGRHGPAAGMAELVAVWPSAVGEAVACNAWPARFARDGTLHVATSSSAWAFELGHLEREIVPRLRQLLGETAPGRLRFAPGRLPELSAETPADPPQPLPDPSPEVRLQAEAIAAEIEDEDLRKLVAKAAAASLARAANGRSFC